MQSLYYTLRIKFSPESYDYVTSLLYDAELYTFQEESSEHEGGDLMNEELPIDCISCFFGSQEEMKSILQVLEGDSTANFTYTVEEGTSDYLNAWKEFAKEIEISDSLCIVPTWIAESPDYNSSLHENRETIILDPAYAFGSGSHETTILCARQIERMCKAEVPKTMLDVGCGSGILSIIAARLGVPSVVGIDIDSYAVEASLMNAEQNAVSAHVEFRDTPLSQITDTYDLVVANILSGVIKELFEDLKRVCKPDGVLLLSGILHEELQYLREHLFPGMNENPFLKVEVLGEWCSVEIEASKIKALG